MAGPLQLAPQGRLGSECDERNVDQPREEEIVQVRAEESSSVRCGCW